MRESLPMDWRQRTISPPVQGFKDKLPSLVLDADVVGAPYSTFDLDVAVLHFHEEKGTHHCQPWISSDRLVSVTRHRTVVSSWQFPLQSSHTSHAHAAAVAVQDGTAYHIHVKELTKS